MAATSHGGVIVIMAKAPTPGRVKTRLTPALSPRQAAILYRCFLEDTIARAKTIREAALVVAYSPATCRATFEALCPGVALLPQRGRGLGARLAAVVGRLLREGRRPVIVIGGDTPGLPDRYLRKALRTLTAHRADLVLGPARDGGYYLIGLTSPAPELFDGVPWSTKHVYTTTLERARRLGLRVASLPPWEDVDTPDALGRLAATLARASGTIAPRTKRWLAAAS